MCIFITLTLSCIAQTSNFYVILEVSRVTFSLSIDPHLRRYLRSTIFNYCLNHINPGCLVRIQMSTKTDRGQRYTDTLCKLSNRSVCFFVCQINYSLPAIYIFRSRRSDALHLHRNEGRVTSDWNWFRVKGSVSVYICSVRFGKKKTSISRTFARQKIFHMETYGRARSLSASSLCSTRNEG